MITPTKDQALQFATLLSSGMPSYECIAYFLPEGEQVSDSTIKALHDAWMKSSALKAALLQTQGGAWQDMTLDARVQFSVNKHYSELAYFIYSRSFVEVTGAELNKLNEARKVLEAKLAGTAGKSSPIEAFWADVMSGKVKLQPVKTAATLTLPAN